ncbi:ABC-F family ATP-binding cassette domain-containing protein [Xanthocytophaga agilis]|uniref:ABC-F family ATP-binding cassette domain-containing protein n=1 Tax=Xanthocytophaga agilis TaxID=3048010 RepID=A0AAE3QY56_9BACT|nr:ABC-F family ATP-binding cassette domain-containing protein [Xanthocytophaga agilis]MDJ1500246.1 ABC-F family ATP-binding cassette domain-containing protein [Xanthocytophaga agilis]
MSIILRSISYIHPDREVLFRNLTLSLATGEKAAFIGPNGTGKSTLLQIMAGRLQASEGDITLSEKPYYVPQHMGQYDAFSLAEMLGVDQKIKALRAILQGDASPEHFTALDDDWEIEERVKAALELWQLQHLDLGQTLQSLSGGEKTKVFLAGISIHSPKIILMDEPSNHLDTHSRDLLYAFISGSKATIVVVSHDRTLLNLLPVTLELSHNGIEVYGGNYDFYKEQKETKLQALQEQVDDKEKTLKQAQQKAREVAEQRHKKEARGKAHGQKLALPRIIANSRKGQAEQSTAKLKEAHNEKISGISEDLKELKTQIQASKVLQVDLRKSDLHQGKNLIAAKAINFAYTQQKLWSSPLSFQIRSGDRIRISGNNGAGKTTLLHLITGKLSPSEGEVYRADFHYIYMDQEYSAIKPQYSIVEQIEKFNTRHLQEHELKMLLYQHQFGRDMWDRKCADLSGGEKMKLLLCCLAASDNTPDMVILDEPTNNLDIHSQEVLTHAIQAFTGTVLVISHDQYFIQQIQAETTLELG